MEARRLLGAGGLTGGGSSNQQPVPQAPSNLRSQDRMEAVIGLCQGPIRGLTLGPQSLYFGLTPYQNPDGSYNFPLFEMGVNVGDTPAAPITPWLGGIENFNYWGMTLNYENPQTFNTNEPGLDQIIIRLQIFKLFQNGTDPTLAALPGAPQSYVQFLPNTARILVTYTNGSGEGLGSPSMPINPLVNDINSGVSGGYAGPGVTGPTYDIVGQTENGQINEIRFKVVGPGPFAVTVTNLTMDLQTAPCKIAVEGWYEVNGGIFGSWNSTTVQEALEAPNNASYGPISRITEQPPQNPNGTTGINMLSLRIVYSALYETSTHGTYVNGTAYMNITYLASSAPAGTQPTNPFGGPVGLAGLNYNGAYTQQLTFGVPQVNDTYIVTVEDVTPLNSMLTVQAEWQSMEEIVGGPIQYDGVACLHVYGQASGSFSSFPNIWGVYDLKLCRIPTNYDGDTHVYSGPWDGTFQEAWTNNPAWCLFDLVTNSTYGVRTYWPNFNLDPYDVYAAALWCDQLVPGTNGAQQPRWTYNGLITQPLSVRNLLSYMAGVFNGVIIDDINGTIRLAFDNDNYTAAALFTIENVADTGGGAFTYTYTDPTKRFNYITAHFHNPLLYYQLDTRLLYDQSQIDQFGRVSLDFHAEGCTDPQEVMRRAAYKLITATTETEIVTFTTTRLGLLLKPFDIILVADPDMNGAITGRILSIDSTRTVVQLSPQMPLNLVDGVSYTFWFQIPNSAYGPISPPISEPATFAPPPLPVTTQGITFTAQMNGANTVIVLDTPLPAGVDARANFSVSGSTTDSLPKPYRVTQIEEVAGDHIKIEAIEVNTNKWPLVDNISNSAALVINNFTGALAPPTGLAVTSAATTINASATTQVPTAQLTWTPSTDPRTTSYSVQYQLQGADGWLDFAVTRIPSADIFGVQSNTYNFRVRANGLDGTESAWTMLYGQGLGMNIAPSAPTNFAATVVGNNVILSWTPVTTINFAHYWLRFTPNTSSTATWANATDLVPQTTSTTVQVAAATGTYFIATVNAQGISSNTPASATVTGTNALLLVDNTQQAPGWTAGTITNCTVDSTTGFLDLTLPATYDPLEGWNVVGSYVWESMVLPAAYTVRLVPDVMIGATQTNDTMNTWSSLSNLTYLDRVSAQDYSVSLAVQIWDATTSAWGAPTLLALGDYTGSQFRYTATLTSNTQGIQPILESAVVQIYAQGATEQGSNITTPAASYVITYTNFFQSLPVLTITLKNGASGDYYSITNETTSGFTIEFFDSAGAAVARTFDWQANGFGGIPA